MGSGIWQHSRTRSSGRRRIAPATSWRTARRPHARRKKGLRVVDDDESGPLRREALDEEPQRVGQRLARLARDGGLVAQPRNERAAVEPGLAEGRADGARELRRRAHLGDVDVDRRVEDAPLHEVVRRGHAERGLADAGAAEDGREALVWVGEVDEEGVPLRVPPDELLREEGRQVRPRFGRRRVDEAVPALRGEAQVRRQAAVVVAVLREQYKLGRLRFGVVDADGTRHGGAADVEGLPHRLAATQQAKVECLREDARRAVLYPLVPLHRHNVRDAGADKGGTAAERLAGGDKHQLQRVAAGGDELMQVACGQVVRPSSPILKHQ